MGLPRGHLPQLDEVHTHTILPSRSILYFKSDRKVHFLIYSALDKQG